MAGLYDVSLPKYVKMLKAQPVAMSKTPYVLMWYLDGLLGLHCLFFHLPLYLHLYYFHLPSHLLNYLGTGRKQVEINVLIHS